jgi:hypothetical protein
MSRIGFTKNEVSRSDADPHSGCRNPTSFGSNIAGPKMETSHVLIGYRPEDRPRAGPR